MAGDVSQVDPYLQQALNRRRLGRGDDADLWPVLITLADVADSAGNHEQAVAWLSEALDVAYTNPDPERERQTLMALSHAFLDVDPRRAVAITGGSGTRGSSTTATRKAAWSSTGRRCRTTKNNKWWTTSTPHVIMGGRGFDPDLFDPNGAADTQAGFHTDGTWIWPAAVPHYLAKHGVPPEADLVAHLRATGFTPPELDQGTKDAAYLALTGELPAAPKKPDLVISDRDRRVLAIIELKASEAGAVPEAYQIPGSAEGALCLERVGEQWQVADYERGKPRNPQQFTSLWDAGAYLLGSLTVSPTCLRAGGGDLNTAQALNDWPIQPLPGEPPLTLLAEKHIAVLMPGREIVRHSPPEGNFTFADGTEFSAMSLRAEREQQGPRRYRVARARTPWPARPCRGTTSRAAARRTTCRGWSRRTSRTAA